MMIIDQKTFDEVANIFNDIFITGLLERMSSSSSSSPSTTMIYKEREGLNQDATLILFVLAALLFCACVLASTLAFVKNRHTLKRKSRITEMEAFLDDHYRPFLFPQQQQHHK